MQNRNLIEMLPEKLEVLVTGAHDSLALLSRQPTAEDQRLEAERMEALRQFLSDGELVVATGNTFEWTRGRILEPHQLKATVIAENGLIAQNTRGEVYWNAGLLPEYLSTMQALESLASKLGPHWIQQGKRTTFKAGDDKKRFDQEFVPKLVEYAQKLGCVLYESPDQDLTGKVSLMRHNPGSSLDCDPVYIEMDERIVKFGGKGEALERLAGIRNYNGKGIVAIGRSRSDVQLFQAVQKLGGTSVIPNDAEFNEKDMQLLKNMGVIKVDVSSPAIIQWVISAYK